MLMASGANFGFRRTIPHMCGIGIGFAFMIFCVGLGLMQVFDQFPILHSILKVVSVAYLLWLAWKIANSAAPEGSIDADAKPMTFFQAALFQWVNPKAWTMALTAIAVYTEDQTAGSVLIVSLAFGIVNFPSVSIWTGLGQILAGFLTNTPRLRAFNWTMAMLLILSLYPLFLQ